MAGKTQRHSLILRLVQDERVESQEALRKLLAREGINVAQGTLSRDIRELGLIKTQDEHGSAIYAVPVHAADPTPDLLRLLPNLFLDADGVDSLLVIHTLVGGAQPLAVAIDHQQWDEVIGTIAGDDTILLILRDRKARHAVTERVRRLAAGDGGEEPAPP